MLVEVNLLVVVVVVIPVIAIALYKSWLRNL
jgi:hypothetical protein